VTRAAIISAFDPERYKGGIETFILNLKTLLSEKDIVLTCISHPRTSPAVNTIPVKCLSKVALIADEMLYDRQGILGKLKRTTTL